MADDVVGLVLAAGAGRRFGGPKALATDLDGVAWVQRTARVLHDGGCDRVVIVVGAAADQVSSLTDPGDEVVLADDWSEGMGASLRAGLRALSEMEADPTVAALVMLVDLPGVGPDVVNRVLTNAGMDVLARAAYHGEVGHPVLLGRSHWDAVAASAHGDQGAREYLASHATSLIECGDIGSPDDVDYR